MTIKKILAACMAITIVGGAAISVPQSARDYSITASAELDLEGNEYTEGVYESLTYWKYADHIAIAGCDFDYEGELTIPSEIEGMSVTVIGYEAFVLCDNITSVILPDSVTTIDRWAFEECEKLESVVIPESVTSIEMCAFYGCESLRSVVIPESVTVIEPGVFSWCQGLESITIPDSITIIGNGAFSNCSSISSITIPGNVTSIEYGAFAACESLDSITILNPDCEIFDDPFTICGSFEFEADADYPKPDINSVAFDGTIYGYANSTAQAYAEKYGYNFKSLEEAPGNTELMLGDTNGDGVIDATDASNILALYAKLSTSDGTPTTEELKVYDVNRDGAIDATDASAVLAYYAYASTENADMSFEDFMKDK